ncbi:16S rRNA (guanine(966)-N(2))-methyltransferase RsmD [uncultured Megasphaera sp.]|uniref:16S rRNA (guanine(966)-N(2))-methyltransferase RsmD n=1 Tax=uncultured Megasphaera sp. TaxID=165188 RepID=UPI00265AF814|nr:16S rRNA (guanine(966)-N(2))-methyltransferase RsmD [uncultured Megasphaera sp.]
MRIIAGSAKGRTLKSPKGMLTRPTLDRTRESLFNILANGSLAGANVLDIFAGTGALGLEALSRGAAHCVFIDHYTQALIRENAEACGFGKCCEIFRLNVERALARLKGRQFQYIFADPPYNKNLVNNTIALVCQYDLLSPDGLLLMEHSRNEAIDPSPLYEVIREKSYGKDTRITFIRVCQGGIESCESEFARAALTR